MPFWLQFSQYNVWVCTKQPFQYFFLKLLSRGGLAQCAEPTRVATSTSFLVLRRVLSSSNASKTEGEGRSNFTAYPRIRVSTSSNASKNEGQGWSNFTAYPRIHCFFRGASKNAGYCIVTPLLFLDFLPLVKSGKKKIEKIPERLQNHPATEKRRQRTTKIPFNSFIFFNIRF